MYMRNYLASSPDATHGQLHLHRKVPLPPQKIGGLSFPTHSQFLAHDLVVLRHGYNSTGH